MAETSRRPEASLAYFAQSDEIKKIRRYAGVLATFAKEKPPVINTSCLLFAIAEIGRSDSFLFRTPHFLWSELNSSEKMSYRDAFLHEFPHAQYPSNEPIINYNLNSEAAKIITDNVHRVFSLASEISSRSLKKLPAETAGKIGKSTVRISTRHLMAALLVFKPENGNTTAVTRLLEMLPDMLSLRVKFVTFIDNALPTDNHKAWRKILLPAAELSRANLSIDIFLSYASADRERVRFIVDALLQEGFSVWWDQNIQFGEKFSSIIKSMLDTAKCVIVVWSESSVRSHWVEAEAHRANKKGKLIPVLIDAVEDEIPLEFSRIQTAQLINPSGGTQPEKMRSLIESVKELVDKRNTG